MAHGLPELPQRCNGFVETQLEAGPRERTMQRRPTHRLKDRGHTYGVSPRHFAASKGIEVGEMESQETETRSSGGSARKLWWLGGLGALVALKFYYVREMVAALMIFSALFVIGAAIVLVVFVLDRITQRTFAWAQSGAGRLARWAANSSGAIVGHIGLSSQRLRFARFARIGYPGIANSSWCDDCGRWRPVRSPRAAPTTLQVLKASPACQIWLDRLGRSPARQSVRSLTARPTSSRRRGKVA